jgi:hypothetical protein
MDGRDQPDTNVVRIRRKGDPSEAERTRLASTIFAEQDDVGTFSHGNLVPPRTGQPDKAPDDGQTTVDPYFENLQRTNGGHGQSATERSGDPETIAYFDRLATQSAGEMAAMVDAQSGEPAMPGSAQLPADLAHAARRRPHADSVSMVARRTMPRIGWIRAPGIARLVRPTILATLAATLVAGAAFAAILAEHEQPAQHAPNTRASTSSAPLGLAALRGAFAAIQHQTKADAIGEQKAPGQRRVARPSGRRHHAKPRRSRPHATGGTHLTLTADHTPTASPETTTTRPTTTTEAVATNDTTAAQQTEQPSSHAAARNQPAGPSGLGQVVGRNCDPKCK